MRDATDDDLDLIREGLRASARQLATDLLGNPSSKTGSEWRWGRKGSLALSVAGAKRGLWHDHESDQGGDMLALIRRERGGSFPDTVAWARGFLGMGEAPEWIPHERQAKPQDAAKEATAEAEDAARRTVAERLWREAVPAGGTVADRYLTETRRIPRPGAGWPASAVRFHPGRCALILAATTAAGDVQAVQLVYLTAEATKREDENRPTKQSFGPQAGAVVRLPGDGSVLVTAEGPETGLSAWAATGRETWIALGSVGKVEPPPLRRVLVCADDDPKDAPASKQLRKAVAGWRRDGWEVAVATPWNPRRYDKSDFNDLMRRDGATAVLARIEAALLPQGPQPPGNAIPVDLARLKLGKAVDRFGDAVRAYDPGLDALPTPPPVHAIRVSVGLGKSAAALRLVAALIREMRVNGDTRNAAIACPTHKLAAELAKRFRGLAEAAGLTVAVWRGREADDPEAPGERMCQDIEAVRDVQSVGADPETSVCRDKKTGDACQFFNLCGAQRLRRQRADVWFMPHELLFSEKPAAMGKLALVVVDEAPWRKGLEGVDGPPMDLTLDTLNPAGLTTGKLGRMDADRLHDIHRRTADALAKMPDGPLRRDALQAAFVTHETGRDGRALSWERVEKVDIHPGMSRTARREAVAAVAGNKAAMRLARFFGAVEALMAEGGPEASGWAALVTNDTPEGPVRAIRLRGRRKVAKGFQVPTLHLDANLNADLLRPYWPQVEVTADLDALTPHMRVRQLTGRDWTKSALVPHERNSQAENERVVWNRDKLRAAVWREARRVYPGRVLVVVQKAVEDAWREFGVIPSNVELAHHNSVAGRDEWGPQPNLAGVVLLIVVGRTQPPTDNAERMAGALTGAAVETRAAGFRYDRRDAAIHLADGTSIGAEAECHPDPMAEAVRWQICEGELVQIVGRVRGANRTAANPVDVLVLTDRPLPIPVDETVTWEDLMPSPADLMLAQGGVALDSPTDAARCYENLWTEASAKKAAQRGQWGTSSYGENIHTGMSPTGLRRATYQRAGARQRPAFLIFDPVAVPAEELSDWLADRLGPLARCEVEGPPEPTPPGPGKRAPAPSEPPAGMVEPASGPEPAWAGAGEPAATCSEVRAARSLGNFPSEPAASGEVPQIATCSAWTDAPLSSDDSEAARSLSAADSGNAFANGYQMSASLIAVFSDPGASGGNRQIEGASGNGCQIAPPADLGGDLHPSAMGMRPICRIGPDLDGFRFGSDPLRGFSEQYARTREATASGFSGQYARAREGAAWTAT